jgi:hypothetical protein
MADVKSEHYTVTLSGSVQVLPTASGGGKVRWLSLQPDGANANPVFLGGPGLTTSDYGTRLPAASGGVPPAPHVIAEFSDGSMAVQDFYVLGTSTEKLHVHVLIFT